ncbi:MAG: hypothetical protein JW850_20810 [Thermoflexales bacterium]|nr:hypothetical protein [Thermoflexales bacterium]
MTTRLTVDVEHIAAVLRTLFAPGEVIEVRIPSVPRAGTVSGYFDDFLLAARAAARYNSRADGVYFTLNPVSRVLLARSTNRLSEWAKSVSSDVDVLVRRHLLFDFDPVRPSGISSTEAELAAALERRDAVGAWLQAQLPSERAPASGFPPGLAAMSGNGGHLLYRLPDLPNTPETTDLVRACLAAVKSRFGDDLVSVDDTVFNASRLTKLYGTWARKGDHLPDRPHRLSHLELPTGPVAPLSLDQLRWLANQAAATPSHARHAAGHAPVFTTTGRRLDVGAYLAAAGQEYRARSKGGVTWYNFKDCPVHTDPDGDRYECGICQFDNGALGAKCQHDPTATWADFKAALGNPAPYYVGGDPLQSGRPSSLAVALASPASPGECTLDHLTAYARCPMEYTLRYQAGARVSPTGEDLVQHTVLKALRDFHAGLTPSPFAAVRANWRALLDEWGIEKPDKAYTALEDYARLRTELLLPFLRGEILKPDGSPYAEPRKSQIFHNTARARGLHQLQVSVDGQISRPPVSLRSGDCLGDVFADALEIALRYQLPAQANAQASEGNDLIGVQVPFGLDLSDDHLSGQADLLLRVRERGQSGLVAVVYDFGRLVPWDILRRDLRVLALLNAGGEFWRGEASHTVRVHYLRVAETVSVYGTSNPAWGRALLAAAVHALSTPGVPRMAIAPHQCAGCRYRETCSSPEGWNVLMRGIDAPSP